MLCIDSNELHRMYWGEKKSAARMAMQFGVTHQAVLRLMEKLGIQRRSRPEANSWMYKSEPPITAHHLRQLYVLEKKSTRKIAKERGMAQSSVRRWMIRFQIPARKGGSPLKYPRKPFYGNEKEKAYLLGLRAGDLYAQQRTPNTVEVTTATTHPAMIDLFYNIFDKYGHCNKYPRESNMGYEWALYCGLDTSFGFLKDKPLKLPNDELFYEFLAGYIDSEGCWKIAPNHHAQISFGLVICSEDLELLTAIKEKLERDKYHISLGINRRKSRFNDTRPLYELCVNRRSEVISLIDRILLLSQHREKIEKMKLIVEMKNETAWLAISDRIQSFRRRLKEEVGKCVREARMLYEHKHKIPIRARCLPRNSKTLSEFAIFNRERIKQN